MPGTITRCYKYTAVSVDSKGVLDVNSQDYIWMQIELIRI